MKLIIDQIGLSFYYRNKEYKTPFEVDIYNHEDKRNIETELRKQGIEYKIYFPNKSIVNLSGKELPFSCYKDPIDKRDYNVKSILKQIDLNNKTLSSSNKISYRNEMSPVKDQGNLGSCVGFAVAAMKEWQEQKEYIQEIKKGNPYRREQDHYNLSEQWIYYKAKDIDPWPNSEGTTIRHALKQISKFGIPPEKGWKYNDDKKGKPEIWTHMISKWTSGGNYYRIKYGDLVNSLNKFGPIVIGIYCFREIFNVTSNGFVGYPRYPFEKFGGHAICITGYDPKTRRYEFKNSWGSTWGNYGYGYLPDPYLRDFMLDAWVFIDKDVKRDSLRN